tara:strand:+ start:731 stop:1072 length:342 start_codon:yes stop_codon:yes gene_type:complete
MKAEDIIRELVPKLVSEGDRYAVEVKDTGGSVQLWFNNQLGLSVSYKGERLYMDEDTVELAAIKRDGKQFDVVYSKYHGWGDVRGWQSLDDALVAAKALRMSRADEFFREIIS